LVEFESGRKNNRPQLIAAIQKCRLYGATLIVGRMDRLARNVAFVSALMESGIDFVACDFPQANRLTVHLLAAMAEHEAALISSRIKSALVIARQNGRQLGNRHMKPGSPASAAIARAVRVAQVRQRDASILPAIAELRAEGITTLAGLAAALNERGAVTSFGAKWHPNTVRRILARAA
jgi:DNA invertase Pin-like site-specific DNA recombinase